MPPDFIIPYKVLPSQMCLPFQQISELDGGSINTINYSQNPSVVEFIIHLNLQSFFFIFGVVFEYKFHTHTHRTQHTLMYTHMQNQPHNTFFLLDLFLFFSFFMTIGTRKAKKQNICTHALHIYIYGNIYIFCFK